MNKRTAIVKRETKETDILVKFNLDGHGKHEVNTGIPFLDHMLSLFAKHGLFDLLIEAQGDLQVDIHHTNEDVGICLGQAFAKALGQKKGISRFADASVPMDEALVRIALDISGRASLHINLDKKVKLSRHSQEYNLEDAKHFLGSLFQHAGINAYIDVIAGNDLHHVLEAIFKTLARTLDTATRIDARIKGIPSTKGRI